MNDLKSIQEFLSLKRIAVVGVSRKKTSFANDIFDKMIRSGYDAVPVNPHMTTFRERPCYARLTDITPPVDGAIILTPKSKTGEVIAEATSAGIKNLWIQQECATPETLGKLRNYDGLVITGECILMFLEPVQSFHKFHRWLAKVFKKYPM